MQTEREGDPSQIHTPARRGHEAREGASGQEVAKTPSSGAANHPDKPVESSIPQMLVTEQTASQPGTEVAETSSRSAALDSVTRQYVSRSDKRADVPFTVETSRDEPPQTQDGFEPKPSPFLEAMTSAAVFQAEAKHVRAENAELAVKAAKYDRQWQQKQDSYYRIKDADIEAQREKWRVTKAQQRAQQRQKAQAQDGQKSPKNRS